MSLIYLAKKHIHVFKSKSVIEKLISLLFPTTGSYISPKKATVLCQLSCEIVNKVYQDEKEWPIELVKAYIADSLGERIWVDNEHSKEFVANILTAFPQTQQTLQHTLQHTLQQQT